MGLEPIGQYRKPWAFSARTTDATPVVLKAARNATDATIFVTKLTLSIITPVAGTAIFRDSTPTTWAAHTDVTPHVSGTASVVYWEFGKEGIELSLGKNFEFVGVAAGVFAVYAEGYEVANS